MSSLKITGCAPCGLEVGWGRCLTAQNKRGFPFPQREGPCALAGLATLWQLIEDCLAAPGAGTLGSPLVLLRFLRAAMAKNKDSQPFYPIKFTSTLMTSLQTNV